MNFERGLYHGSTVIHASFTQFLACSGIDVPGRIAEARVIGITSFGLCLACLLFQFAFIWRVRKLFYPLSASALFMAFHPNVWVNPSGGDCGASLESLSKFWIAGSVLLLTWALVIISRAPKPSLD